MTSNKQWWHWLKQREARVADLYDTRYDGENKVAHANPYYSAYVWWWDDEMGHEYGPYETQQQALHALLKHLAPKGPSLWQRLKEKLRLS